MLVTVRLFARLREIAGGRDIDVDVPAGSTVRDVWSELVERYPELSQYTPSISCAVNEDYARMTATLRDGDDVAFLPPVSGGSGGQCREAAPARESEWGWGPTSTEK